MTSLVEVMIRGLIQVVLVFNIFAGLTLALSDYSKSLNYEYESARLESYGMEATLEFNDNYFFQFDIKRLSAQVQSSTGKLNVFGWDYTHDIAMLKFGMNLNENNSVYLSPTVYYFPTLFPTQVGALSSTAAFEKTLTYGLGAGYITSYKIKKIDVKLDANLSLLNFASSEYNSKYSYVIDLDINPTYKISDRMKAGINYNIVAGQASLVEKKTGSDFPFKTSYFLHNLFLTFAYTLQ
jgi:hypothetical protein